MGKTQCRESEGKESFYESDTTWVVVLLTREGNPGRGNGSREGKRLVEYGKCGNLMR